MLCEALLVWLELDASDALLRLNDMVGVKKTNRRHPTAATVELLGAFTVFLHKHQVFFTTSIYTGTAQSIRTVMPKARQRTVFCDCFDCLDRPPPSVDSAEGIAASDAAARQDPPPKALLIYGSGLLQCHEGETSIDVINLPHLNHAARDGSLGLLAVRNSQAGQAHEDIALIELGQLLGVHKVCTGSFNFWFGGQDLQELNELTADTLAAAKLPSLQSRYKNMSATFASNSQAAGQLALAAGLTLSPGLQLPSAQAHRPTHHSGSLPESSALSTVGQTAAGLASTSTGIDGNSVLGPNCIVRTAERAGQTEVMSSEVADYALSLPNAGQYAERLLAELGADQGSSGTDLLLLHLDLESAAKTFSQQSVSTGSSEYMFNASLAVMTWMDALVKHLMSEAAVRESVVFVLVLSPSGSLLNCTAASAAAAAAVPATANEVDGNNGALLIPGGALLDPGASVATPLSAAAIGHGGGSGVSSRLQSLALLVADDSSDCSSTGATMADVIPQVARPVQSFEHLGGAAMMVAMHAPLLVLRRLPGVIRRDHTQSFGLIEALQRGAQGAMLVDGLLPELAYKLGRAPKYGA